MDGRLGVFVLGSELLHAALRVSRHRKRLGWSARNANSFDGLGPEPLGGSPIVATWQLPFWVRKVEKTQCMSLQEDLIRG
jgi:hypothetical protein